MQHSAYPKKQNNIQYSNVDKDVNSTLVGAPAMTNAPVIMFRPRAWNMLESNVMVRIYEPMYVFDARIFHCWLFINIDYNFAKLDLRLSVTD